MTTHDHTTRSHDPHDAPRRLAAGLYRRARVTMGDEEGATL